MPITLSPRTLDRTKGHLPFGVQLANHLRRAILTGELVADEELEAVATLEQLLDVSRPAVRKALDILENEGLIVRHAGLLTKVARRPEPRIVGDDRYRQVVADKAAGKQLTTTAFAEDHGVSLDRVTYDPITYTKRPATAEDARRLGLKIGTTVLERRWVKCIDDHPKEIQVSVIAYQLVRGTPFAKPDHQPVPGGILAELIDLGYTRLREAQHELVGRPPNGEERTDLQLETVDWVFDSVRGFIDHDDTVVEYSRTIAPMAATVIQFRTFLTPR